LTTAQNDTVLATSQLVTVRQELDGVDVGDLSDMSIPMFFGRQLEDAPQHVQSVKLWMACKKLPPRAALPLPVDGERHMAEIFYFASTLREEATLWFNSLTIGVSNPVMVRAFGTLEYLCLAFEAHWPLKHTMYLTLHKSEGTSMITSRQNNPREKNWEILSDAFKKRGQGE